MNKTLRARRYTTGFALPTVLIASVVLLTILAVSVTATTASRTALKTQYYTQLAQLAGEAGVEFAKACLEQSGNIPTWTENKPLRPNSDCEGNLPITSSVEALIVGGGGGGGGRHAGGGGGGGFRTSAAEVSTQPYTVVVGLGGSGAPNGINSGTKGGTSGSASSVFGVSAAGGGGGGGHGATPSSGGSGGGTSHTGTPGAGNTPSTSPSQGNSGGTGGGSFMGGGGGGAGAAGGNFSGSTSGSGGNGLSSSITGAAVFYAGGGGAGGWTGNTAGTGGLGGGGNGVGNAGSTNAGNGTNGLGGGGGGGGGDSSAGGNGGSGVVIIRYDSSSMSATGGIETTFNQYRVHQFTSSGTFEVTNISDTSCNSNPECWVSYDLEQGIRTSFRVAFPEVDADGRATVIPQSGYVELLRASNGEVFRTYEQPAAQAAVVPSLCSGAARSDLGWNNASITTTTEPIPFPVASAQVLGLSSSPNQQPGVVHYRKDFNVVEGGSYILYARANGAADIYINGSLVLDGASSSAASSEVIDLEPGCNVIHAESSNGGLTANSAHFTAAIARVGASTPLVVTDRSWRVSVGELVGYGHPNYYQDPSGWSPVRDISGPHASVTTWAATSGDNSARWISTTHNLSGANYPFAEYAYFRSDSLSAWTFAQQTQIQLTVACDDLCTVLIDGDEVLSAVWADAATTNVTLSPGQHQVAIELRNTGTVVNPSGVLFSARRTADNVVIDRSDAGWVAATDWFSTPQSFVSYDATFRPSPDI